MNKYAVVASLCLVAFAAIAQPVDPAELRGDDVVYGFVSWGFLGAVVLGLPLLVPGARDVRLDRHSVPHGFSCDRSQHLHRTPGCDSDDLAGVAIPHLRATTFDSVVNACRAMTRLGAP
jgi:hypothetical protein